MLTKVIEYEVQKIVGSKEYNRDEKIHELLKIGRSYSQIAEAIHCGYSTISKVVKNTGFKPSISSSSRNNSTTTSSLQASRKKSKSSDRAVKEILTKDEMAELWSIYNTINRRRAMSNPRLDSFFNILKKIEKKSFF